LLVDFNQIMLKLFKTIPLIVMLACSLFVTTVPSALAFKIDVNVVPKEDNTPLIDEKTSPLQFFENIGNATDLNNIKNETGANVVSEGGLGQITGLLSKIINIIKWAIGGVAVIFTIWTAVRMLTATDEAEAVMTDAKKGLTYLLIGLFSVFAIEIFVNNVLVIGDGNFLGSVDAARNAAGAASAEIRGIYNLGEIFLGIFAVGIIIFNGFKMVTNAGNDEALDNAKKNIGWGIAGIVLVGLSELIVKDILFVDAGQGGFDIERAKQLIVQLTNFISGFIAVTAVVMFIYAGYLYIFSAVGDDNTEKVKQAILGAIIGIIIAAGAYGLVNTFVKFEAPTFSEVIQGQIDSGLGN